MKVFVEKITWLSEVAREAEIVLTSHNTSLLAFCHPCELVGGSALTAPLHAFNAREIQLAHNSVHSINNISGLSHRVVGVLINSAGQLVNSCGFLIHVDDYLPGGIQQGDTISFECGRLDVW